MAPHGAEPFNMGLILRLTGDALQVVENVIPPHLDESPQQVAGVIEHDAWVAALVNQLWDKISHAAIAPGKDAGVVVVAVALMLKHILQIANQLTIRSSGDGGLMHV